MKIRYCAEIVDEDNGKTIVKVSSYSEDGLSEEMGKMKWKEAVNKYEQELRAENEADEVPF